MRSFVLPVFLVILTVNPFLKADIVFPAKLELKEIEPDVFQVTFVLPLINNRKLKAQPLLPEMCQELTEHQIMVRAGQVTETWQIRCQAAQLYGKQVGIQGLTGTQIDIMLFVETLEGRKYSQMLKPARAFYVIPEPPSFPVILADGIYRGTRVLLQHWEILLLLFLLNFIPLKRQSLLFGLMAFVIAQMLSQYLVQEQWLIIPSNMVSLAFLFVVSVTSLDLAKGHPVVRDWFSQLWITSLFWGFLYGGGINPVDPQSGWSFIEKDISLISFNLGSGLGAILGFLLFREFKFILDQILLKKPSKRFYPFIGNAVGILSAALIFYRLSVYVFIPSLFPYISPENMLLALAMGLWFGSRYSAPRSRIVILTGVSFAVGLLPGFMGIYYGFLSIFVLGGVLFFGISIVFPEYISPKYGYPIAIVTTFAHGWYVSYDINQNLTLLIANSMGAFFLFFFFFFLVFYYPQQNTTQIHRKTLRYTGLLIALLAVILRIDQYGQWFDDTLAIEWALGYLRIPLLSILLLVFALLIWPRRRRIHQHLKIKLPRPVLHWVLLVLAFLVLPIGTVPTKNYFYRAEAPTADTAKRVLQQILENIYHAFNLTDEDLLYDQLAQNVSDNLVADIYLDSRRRLTAGVRQGAEVTVKEVSIRSIKKIGNDLAATAGFWYECKWVVTARVQHLQHVHHRQNIYHGIIKIKVNEDRWKIEDIALKSEDRVIIAGAAG